MSDDDWRMAFPTPASEWHGVNRVLGGDVLARLLGISSSSVRRYLSGSRATPDEIAARLHFLALSAVRQYAACCRSSSCWGCRATSRPYR